MKSIKLGPVILPNNIVQAPLAGYSCAPFRAITWRYGRPGFCTTEMISAKHLVKSGSRQQRYLGKHPEEGLLCYQFAASDPNTLGQATALVSEHYNADMIDLNCGCPVGKIRAKGTGSRLLADPEKIYQLARAMKQNTDGAVSIKIRIAGEIGDHDDLAVIDAAQNAGVDFITVHGRHWTERYDVPCDFSSIKKIVDYATVPVFANGDVEDRASLQAISDATGCSGVMIGRASVGQPWLFSALTEEGFSAPSLNEVGNIFLEHIDGLIQLQDEKLAILQSRRLAKYYGRPLTQRKEFTISMQQAESRNEAERLIKEYFY
jgi:tRNA-dihydrouridine synthase B